MPDDRATATDFAVVVQRAAIAGYAAVHRLTPAEAEREYYQLHPSWREQNFIRTEAVLRAVGLGPL